MHTSLVQNQPSGKTHIVLTYEQVWIVIDIVWSADLKMWFSQVNKTTENVSARQCLNMFKIIIYLTKNTNSFIIETSRMKGCMLMENDLFLGPALFIYLFI